MKRKIKIALISLLETFGLRLPRVKQAAKLNENNIARFHSLGVLTNLAVENVGVSNVSDLYMAEAGIGYGETFSFLA